MTHMLKAVFGSAGDQCPWDNNLKLPSGGVKIQAESRLILNPVPKQQLLSQGPSDADSQPSWNRWHCRNQVYPGRGSQPLLLWVGSPISSRSPPCPGILTLTRPLFSLAAIYTLHLFRFLLCSTQSDFPSAIFCILNVP